MSRRDKTPWQASLVQCAKSRFTMSVMQERRTAGFDAEGGGEWRALRGWGGTSSWSSRATTIATALALMQLHYRQYQGTPATC